MCLCLPAPLPGKGICTGSFEEGINGICLLHTEKSGASPLPLPLLYFARSERKQKQNKSRLQHHAGGTVIPRGKPDISTYCLSHY